MTVTIGAHDWVAFYADRRPDAITLACADTGMEISWRQLDPSVSSERPGSCMG
jgi:hypothetical protein